MDRGQDAQLGHDGTHRHNQRAFGVSNFPLLSAVIAAWRTEDPSYLDDALEAIIPLGRDRRPKSKLWGELLETISPDQASTIRAFLAHVRSDLLQSNKEPFVVSGEEVHTDEAETFWDAQIRSLTRRTKR
jgi:hypothetical protein